MARTYKETVAAIDADDSIDKDRKKILISQAQDREYGEELFDLDRYRQAAGVAYDYSKKKLEDTGREGRTTIGKQAEEERASTQQRQEFSQSDEERDNRQAQRAYKY